MIDTGKLGPAGRMIVSTSRRFGWIEVSLIALVIGVSLLGVGYPARVEATTTFPPHAIPVYIPMATTGNNTHVDSVETEPPVITQPTQAPTAIPTPTPTPEPTCQLNGEEQAILNLMTGHPEQGRAAVICNPILSQVARAKAADMANRNYFAHVDPDGHGPNYLVTVAGFRLPSYYPTDGSANNIESIGAGYRTYGEVWQAWLDSRYHKVHVLGTDGFYADQQQVGIGYVNNPNSHYQDYWVVLSAPTETD